MDGTSEDHKIFVTSPFPFGRAHKWLRASYYRGKGYARFPFAEKLVCIFNKKITKALNMIKRKYIIFTLWFSMFLYFHDRKPNAKIGTGKTIVICSFIFSHLFNKYYQALGTD